MCVWNNWLMIQTPDLALKVYDVSTKLQVLGFCFCLGDRQLENFHLLVVNLTREFVDSLIEGQDLLHSHL